MIEIEEMITHLKQAIEDVSLGRLSASDLNDDAALLDELGLDSLDFAAVMLSGENFSGRKINENNINWQDVRTIRQLAEAFYG